MPMDRSRYPKNWDAIALAVKESTGWRCENCDRECRRPAESKMAFMTRLAGDRLSDCPVIYEYLEHPTRWVLTVAHLDHRPENCDRSNLKALCAPCHCRYDLAQMRLKKMLKLERAGQLTIFGVEAWGTPLGGDDHA